MFKKTKINTDTYGIIGLGRFGTALALSLAEAGADLIVLDRDEEKVRNLREYTDNAFVVTSLDKKSLSETGIQNCDVAVVCVGEQMDVSILTTLNLVSLGVPKVLAKASSQEHGEILEKLGAEVVYPERDMGQRLANRLEASRTLDYIQLSEKLNISKVLLPEALAGKTVLEANLRRKFSVNIIAVERGSTLTQVVVPDFTFQKGDILFLAGSREALSNVMGSFNINRP